MTRRAFSPGELAETPYNHGIVDNGKFSMSGQVSRDSDGNVVGRDLEAQTRKTFGNIEVLLERVNKDLDDVAKVTVYIMGKQDCLNGYKRVYDEFFRSRIRARRSSGRSPLATHR
jgi:enamine deaminase RidA (YjgF/YER057c/UK114 family)